MYTLKDKTIVLELGGIQIKESTLKNIKEELDLKTNLDVENYIQTITDRTATEYLERFEDFGI
tara:strand:+ start:403 stop:591 length:189 start_codon:yes stop_codon:yes gene_type:complete